jgi:hypothetical protein
MSANRKFAARPRMRWMTLTFAALSNIGRKEFAQAVLSDILPPAHGAVLFLFPDDCLSCRLQFRKDLDPMLSGAAESRVVNKRPIKAIQSLQPFFRREMLANLNPPIVESPSHMLAVLVRFRAHMDLHSPMQFPVIGSFEFEKRCIAAPRRIPRRRMMHVERTDEILAPSLAIAPIPPNGMSPAALRVLSRSPSISPAASPCTKTKTGSPARRMRYCARAGRSGARGRRKDYGQSVGRMSGIEK